MFQADYDRYSYCKHNEVTFLWKQLSSLNIKLDIKGAWKPTLNQPMDVFLMEALIDKGYDTFGLEVLNDVRVYMQVIVLSDISKERRHMAKWALAGQQNSRSQWSWPPRRVPTQQNLKVWRDCLRGTFMQGINGLLEQITAITPNCTGHTAYPLFKFSHMKGGTSLMATIRQYPPERLSVIGDINISDPEG